MSEHIKSIIGSGVAIGSGLACEVSPLTGIVVSGFYDGATQGVARTINTDAIVFFRLVWWDERQDNRVFEGIAISILELKRQAPELFAFYERRSNTTDWASPVSDVEGKLVVELESFIVRSSKKIRFTMLCRTITGEMFLLPELDS